MPYKVPFVDLPTMYKRLENELIPVIRDVLFTRADFIMRGDLRQFEEDIASFVGVNHAIGVNSGTDALYLSLLAGQIGGDDEVITVAHTFVATVAAIIHCGAKPILVDVGEDFNMNVEQVEQVISSKTKAILPVHLNGRLCDMEKLTNIAHKHSLLVIEDAAQAMGAAFNGEKAGSFGLAGCFSLYPMKILGGIGDGGVVVTHSEELAEKIRLLRDHGQNRKTGDLVGYGFNSRLDNFNAAILNLRLSHLQQSIERRRELAALYHQGLSDLYDIELPPSPQTDERYFDVYQNYVIRVQERDRLVEHLNKCGIEVLISWRNPMHHHEALNLGHFHLPNTERISKEVVSLPLNTEMSDDQVGYVIESIRRFYQR